jgi:putative transposase
VYPLNTHRFLSVADARERLECWRRDYNQVRSHGAIGNKPPAVLLDCGGVASPPISKEAGRKNLVSGEGTLEVGAQVSRRAALMPILLAPTPAQKPQ